MRLGSLIALRAGPYAAHLSPEGGARLTSLTWAGATGAHDLIKPIDTSTPFDPHHWPAGGAFPMAPFSNRLGGATFQWGARRVDLSTPPGETYALHGFAHRVAWDVLSQTASEAVLGHVHRSGDEGWPWAFEMTMRVALDHTSATVHLRITNRSDEAMPAGLGWHPYHSAHGLAGHPEARLQLMAHACRDVGLSGLARLPPHGALARPRHYALGGADLHHQTCVFEDWSGNVSLPMATGFRIAVNCTGANHLVMHAARALGHLCVEPVTLLPGALQVYDAAQSAAMIALAPGCWREISWRCGVLHEVVALAAAV